jgi:hypothetical protein
MSARTRRLCRVACLVFLVVGAFRLIGWGLGHPTNTAAVVLAAVSVTAAAVGLVGAGRARP